MACILLHPGAKDRMNGQVVNTVIQVTSEPRIIAVIINKRNFTHEFIVKSKVFSASVLKESAPMKFLGTFGFRSRREFDKLSNVSLKKVLQGVL